MTAIGPRVVLVSVSAILFPLLSYSPNDTRPVAKFWSKKKMSLPP